MRMKKKEKICWKALQLQQQMAMTYIGKIQHIIVVWNELLFIFHLACLSTHRFNENEAHDNNQNEHSHYGNCNENG